MLQIIYNRRVRLFNRLNRNTMV